jgi:hypothetical protein
LLLLRYGSYGEGTGLHDTKDKAISGILSRRLIQADQYMKDDSKRHPLLLILLAADECQGVVMLESRHKIAKFFTVKEIPPPV